MISEEVKGKIKSLYLEKKHDELVNFIEKSTVAQNRPSALINILAISYHSKKNPTSDDFHQSLNLFEEAYLKEKNTLNGLNAIKNLIITGIKICRVSKEFIKYLLKAKHLYLEAESNFNNKEEFLQSGILLFTYLLEKKKLREITNKILKGNIESNDLRGQATFMTNYFFDWSQEDIINISKQNSDYYSS